MFNPSEIDQSRLQCDCKNNVPILSQHNPSEQESEFPNVFFCTPARIGTIFQQSAENWAIRLQSSINPNPTAHRLVWFPNPSSGFSPDSGAVSHPRSRVVCNSTGRTQSSKSWRNRGSCFLQSTRLWLKCGKSPILSQFRLIGFDCNKIVPGRGKYEAIRQIAIGTASECDTWQVHKCWKRIKKKKTKSIDKKYDCSWWSIISARANSISLLAVFNQNSNRWRWWQSYFLNQSA